MTQGGAVVRRRLQQDTELLHLKVGGRFGCEGESLLLRVYRQKGVLCGGQAGKAGELMRGGGGGCVGYEGPPRAAHHREAGNLA